MSSCGIGHEVGEGEFVDAYPLQIKVTDLDTANLQSDIYQCVSEASNILQNAEDTSQQNRT
jgi:hypothetical protein